MSINTLLCHCKVDLITALRQIDKNGKHTVFIVNDENKFMGVLTDGDIRRHILSERSLNIPASQIVTEKDSYSCKIDENYLDIINIIPENIQIIPLLNEQQQVVDYVELNKEFHVPIASTELNGNELANVIECVTSNWISSQGRFVGLFEKKFAEFIGVQEGVAVTNGTTALHLALLALGVGPGDEVIVPDLTFAATINAVLYVGATPVLVDINPKSWCIESQLIAEAITPKTKAIIPVHLFGCACNMKVVMELARTYNLYVIEDCAQAHGAEFEGKKVGTFGHINCFSFFANKIITTGEGGMCLTDNPELAHKLKILRDHGMEPGKRYWHNVVGYNYRMTNLQAAIGVAQIERIDQILLERERILLKYHNAFRDCGLLIAQQGFTNRKSVTWLVSFVFADESIDRDEFIKRAQEKNISVRPFFYPLSTMPIYAQYADTPMNHSQYISKRGVCLPTVIGLTNDEYDFICQEILRIIC